MTEDVEKAQPRGVLIQIVLYAAIGLYCVIAGSFLIDGNKLAVTGACCIPPESVCPSIKTGNIPTISANATASGLCQLSQEDADLIGCPAAANQTDKCSNGVEKADKLCTQDTGRALILGTAISSIILGAFAFVQVIVLVIWQPSLRLSVLQWPCLILMAVTVIVLLILSPWNLSRIFLYNTSANEVSSCDLMISDVCVSWSYAFFKSTGTTPETCPWSGDTRSSRAQLLTYLQNVEDLKRPSLAICVFSYVFFCVFLAGSLGVCFCSNLMTSITMFLDGDW